MKKLMIAAAVAVLGIAANAAQVKWEAGDVYVRGTETAATDYLVYYVDAATYSYSDAETAIAKGDISFLTKEGVYAQVGAYDDDGYIVDKTADRYANGASVTAYAVVLDADSIADAKYAFLGGSDTKSIGTEGQPPTMFLDTSDTSDGSKWSAVAVPEPTSGLLLLLGVAGLALRRRRA